jgi:hypothetical protein
MVTELELPKSLKKLNPKCVKKSGTLFIPSVHEAYIIVSEKSLSTSKKTHCFSFTKINWLMLLREITVVYSEKNGVRRIKATRNITLNMHNKILINMKT